jgi:peptidoglycan/LPS O-acetylase OafA/YrhL
MKNRLLHLDGIRGLLALSVVLGHWLGSRLGWGNVNFSHSYISVDGFFILSGFVLSYVYAEKLKNGTISLVCYFLHRLARLYPLHILTMFFIFLIYSNFYQAFPFQKPLETAFYNLFLLHGLGFAHSWNWNDPSWSISVEFFGSVLAIPILIKIRNNLLLATVSAIGYIIVIANHHNLMAATDVHFYIFSSGIIKSISGMSLGVMVRNLTIDHSSVKTNNIKIYLLQIISMITVSYFIYTKDSVLSYDGLVIIAITYIVYSTTSYNTFLTKLLSCNLLSGLGKISFSLYLLHTPLMLTLDQISFFRGKGFLIQSFIFSILILLISIIGYNLFELPSYKYLKSKIDNKFKKNIVITCPQ